MAVPSRRLVTSAWTGRVLHASALRAPVHDRRVRWRGLHLVIPRGIHHPGWLSSTRSLVRALDPIELRGVRILDLGCGSGLVSIAASARGAIVTAADTDPLAVETTRRNAERNAVTFDAVLLDADADEVFGALPEASFDLILASSPSGRPHLSAERSARGTTPVAEFYDRLFQQLARRPAACTHAVIAHGIGAEEEAAVAALTQRHGLGLSIRRRRGPLGIVEHQLFEIATSGPPGIADRSGPRA